METSLAYNRCRVQRSQHRLRLVAALPSQRLSRLIVLRENEAAIARRVNLSLVIERSPFSRWRRA